MSLHVCLFANTLSYPEGGGHLWVYLNWALGLRSLGCDVVWLEAVEAGRTPDEVRGQVESLQSRLARHGLTEPVALCSLEGEPLDPSLPGAKADYEADLLLNFQCAIGPAVLRRFRRSALIDIDPGLLQVWLSEGHVAVAPHDVFFTIGETVGRPGARFPDAGIKWQYTPPCVALDWWPVHPALASAPFTTVSHWYQDEWLEDA
jgi:hypothetical protein